MKSEWLRGTGPRHMGKIAMALVLVLAPPSAWTFTPPAPLSSPSAPVRIGPSAVLSNAPPQLTRAHSFLPEALCSLRGTCRISANQPLSLYALESTHPSLSTARSQLTTDRSFELQPMSLLRLPCYTSANGLLRSSALQEADQAHALSHSAQSGTTSLLRYPAKILEGLFSWIRYRVSVVAMSFSQILFSSPNPRSELLLLETAPVSLWDLGL